MNTSTPWVTLESVKVITETIKFLASVLAPLLAGYFGIKYGLKQIKIQKRIDLIETQLNKFYSPLLGLHKEISTKSKLRLKIEQIGNETWIEECKSGKSPDSLLIDKEIDYNNNQLRNDFIPQYNKMLEIFRESYWLAEPETREFYPQLVEFVEIWNRHFGGGFPSLVAHKIKHTEEDLKPFYLELEKRTDLLRKELLKI